MDRLGDLAQQLMRNEIQGTALAAMVDRNELTKGERRKIARLSQSLAKKAEAEAALTKRQLERRATKEKKALPKLSKDDRKRRFHDVIEHKREEEAAKFTICLGCRKRGHFLKDCPKQAKEAARTGIPAAAAELICFNCGSREHSLRACPEERVPGKLPFAVCFICKGQGHLSRDCGQNANGLYPRGGCCHICLLKTHLAKDCPDRTAEHEAEARRRREQAADGVRVDGLLADDGRGGGGDDILDTAAVLAEEDDQEDEEQEAEDRQRKKKQRRHNH